MMCELLRLLSVGLAASLAVSATLSGCSSSIALPAPKELKAVQISYGDTAIVELSWAVAYRVDGYLLHYDDDAPAAPYAGQGLALVAWPAGCGDFDGGTTFALRSSADLGGASDGGASDGGAHDGRAHDVGEHDAEARDGGARDAGAHDVGLRDQGPRDQGLPMDSGEPAQASSSPFKLPAEWCLDREWTAADGGFVPVQSPAARPKVRLTGLRAGRSYHFAVQTYRRSSFSQLSEEATIEVARERSEP